MDSFPKPTCKKNDTAARVIIFTLSVLAFVGMLLLSNTTFKVSLPFDVHLFALANATINSFVAALLIGALIMVKQKKYEWHRRLMLAAIVLSVLFLISYVAHHLFSAQVRFGDTNFDGILSAEEKLAAGSLRGVYFFVLITHIPLAAIILPLILFTAYRALIGEYNRHKKLAKITWPIWLYVAISGVVVYWMIQPYYH